MPGLKITNDCSPAPNCGRCGRGALPCPLAEQNAPPQCANAFRAAQMYTGMAARMTRLLQENAAVIVPDFAATM
jgi:hypothetical protein